MASKLASMDLREQLTILLPGNAQHEDAIGATVVKILFYHRVVFSQPHYALSRHMVFGKDVVLQVVLDLGDPCIGTFLSNWEWLYEVSGILDSAHNLWRAPRMDCHRDR